jgi:hypothetical protein
LLREAAGADLGREVEHRRAKETRAKSLREAIDQVLVRHLEGHVHQLEELSKESPGFSKPLRL